MRHCHLESLQKKVFSIIFISILSTEPSNYDPWKSLPVCQLPNYLINKAIVLSNQQIVKFYENNNLGLCGLQKFPRNCILCEAAFFETPCIIDSDTQRITCCNNDGLCIICCFRSLYSNVYVNWDIYDFLTIFKCTIQ